MSSSPNPPQYSEINREYNAPFWQPPPFPPPANIEEDQGYRRFTEAFNTLRIMIRSESAKFRSDALHSIPLHGGNLGFCHPFVNAQTRRVARLMEQTLGDTRAACLDRLGEVIHEVDDELYPGSSDGWDYHDS